MFKIFFVLTIIFGLSYFVLAKPNNEKNKNKRLEKERNKIMNNLYKLNNINDLAKLGLKADNNKTIAKPSAVPAPIFGPQPASLMRSAPLINTVKAIPGKCDPKPVCITNPLIVNLTPSESVFPPCINIHRCDGCCPINENCVAIQSDELKLSDVVVINMDKGKYQDNIITVQNHTSCECQCIWKTDEDCQKENPNFIKNPDACECICPEEMICSNFHEFDQETCSCKCKKNKFSKLEQICKTRGFDWNEEFCRCLF